MSFLAIAILGLLSLNSLPVSLMPESETPQLRIEVNVPDGSPMFIEQSVLGLLRTASQGLFAIKEVSSIAASSSGQVLLVFEYGTDMKRAYIEAHEKIDQTLGFLPKNLQRPLVRRVLQTDIPIVRLQLTSDSLTLLELSQLSRNVIKRRLEQLPGVSLVEWNGAVKEVIRILPDRSALDRYNIDEQQLIRSIAANNTQIAQIKVNEGIYQYDLTFDNLLEDPENLSRLSVFDKKGTPIPLSYVAAVKRSTAKAAGSHWFQGKQGIVFAIHKRESTDFNQLESQILAAQSEMALNNPEVKFSLTQSQSELLNNSIQQLAISLFLGILLASLVLFFFSASWRSSLIMIILIPMTMLLCFFVLNLFGYSINIITLSGMILGVGILIDNGIILIDNIRTKVQPFGLMQACLKGTVEIVPALVSSAATTLCVFIPLIFLEGVGGALFQQQAFTFGIVLISSLLVTFLFLPLLYLKINPGQDHDSGFFRSVLNVYSRGQSPKMEKRFVSFFFILIGVGVWLFGIIPQEPLPEIETRDAKVAINWDQVMTLEGQESVIRNWISKMDGLETWEADLGNNEIFEAGIPGVEKALIYLQFKDHESRTIGLDRLKSQIEIDHPGTFVTITRAKNPFDQLLGASEPFAVFELRTIENSLIQEAEVEHLINESLTTGLGFQSQGGYRVSFDLARLNALGLKQPQLIEALKIQFGDQLITTVNLVNQSIPVMIRGNEKMDHADLARIMIPLNDSLSYPLAYFIKIDEVQTNRYITADEAGIFQSLEIKQPFADLDLIANELRALVAEKGWLIGVSGAFQKLEENLQYLLFSFSLVILLLYAILAAQFESLKKPFIILAEIPISLSGSLIFLWLFGQSLNLSSMMGIIIMLGIIVNDSILKVDSMNRYMREGIDRDQAIKQAGQDRLKPILMTTLTTILALVPILWSTGLGADIQVPLCVAVMGGLFIGTICSIYLVPLLYRALTPQTNILKSV